jgi:hypothetical protein
MRPIPDASCSHETPVDVIVVIGDKMETRFIHCVALMPVDFLAALTRAIAAE